MSQDARVEAAAKAIATSDGWQHPAPRHFKQATAALAAADRLAPGLIRCQTCHEMKLSLAAAEAHADRLAPGLDLDVIALQAATAIEHIPTDIPPVQHKARVQCAVLKALRRILLDTAAAVEAERYLVWSNVHRAWWRPNAAGYTSYIEAAGRYTRDEAIKHSTGRDQSTDEPLPEIPVRERDVLATIRKAGPT